MTEPNKRTIGLIWSQTPDGVIGANGGIPWEIPEDVQHFQAVTGGRTVIMGRRTWDALPEQARTDPDEVWVIGGAEILAAAIEFATVLAVTEVHVKAEGDAHAPDIPPNFVMA